MWNALLITSSLGGREDIRKTWSKSVLMPDTSCKPVPASWISMSRPITTKVFQHHSKSSAMEPKGWVHRFNFHNSCMVLYIILHQWIHMRLMTQSEALFGKSPQEEGIGDPQIELPLARMQWWHSLLLLIYVKSASQETYPMTSSPHKCPGFFCKERRKQCQKSTWAFAKVLDLHLQKVLTLPEQELCALGQAIGQMPRTDGVSQPPTF